MINLILGSRKSSVFIGGDCADNAIVPNIFKSRSINRRIEVRIELELVKEKDGKKMEININQIQLESEKLQYIRDYLVKTLRPHRKEIGLIIQLIFMREENYEETKEIIGGIANPATKYGVLIYEKP